MLSEGDTEKILDLVNLSRMRPGVKIERVSIAVSS